MKRARPRLLAVALLLAASAAGARDFAWTQQGRCVEVWTPADLAGGPLALLNAALLPPRVFLGGLRFAVFDCRGRCLPTAPLWVAASTLWGTTRALGWAATGILDTLTGGAFLFTPVEATRLTLLPEIPFLESNPSEAHERCRPPSLPPIP